MELQPQPLEHQLESSEIQLQQQIEQQQALAGVISRIRQPLELEAIFQTTATEVRNLLVSDRVAVFRFYLGC